MTSWTLIIAGRPVSHNALGRQHWRKLAAHAKRVRTQAGWLAKAQHIPNLDHHCAVDVVCVFQRNARRDVDNYVSTMLKPAVDALVDASVLTDDTRTYVEKRMPSIMVSPDESEHTKIIIHQLKEVLNGG